MFTFLDFCFVLTILISSAFAYVNGFIQEFISIISWIAAAFFTKYAFPLVEPKISGIVGHGMISSIVSYIVVFIAIIMVLSVFNKSLTAKIHSTNLGSIDKSLGFFFGFVRGIFLMSFFYLIVLWFIPNENNRPDWLKQAKSKPILKVSSMFVSALLPSANMFSEVKSLIQSDMSGSEIATFEKLTKPIVNSGYLYIDSANSSAETGYKDSEIRDLEKQLKQLQDLDFNFRTMKLDLKNF